MKLFFRQQGNGKPLIILHGLLGSSDNWHSLAKIFAEHFLVYTVDQRNHGQSPHSDELNYKLLTQDLEDFMDEHKIEKANLIGHSMGGKTVMNFAIKNPLRVDKLVVVDIVPKFYIVKHDQLVEGMKAIPLKEISTRAEAEQVLLQYEPNPTVGQFLLKNLARDENNRFFWRPNLRAIDEHLQEVGDALQYEGTYNGPSFFINGKKSTYFAPGDNELIQKIFPAAQFVTLDTGHWVQAEKPKEFSDAVMHFLNGQ